MTENMIGREIVDVAIQVHRELGPGLLETVYEVVLAHELRERGFEVDRQVVVPFTYKGLRFDEGFRADLVVNGIVIIELKSVEKISFAHFKQLQSYLRLMDLRLGFLLNFAEALMKDGIKRIANELKE
jgi:GxxExxY protein